MAGNMAKQIDSGRSLHWERGLKRYGSVANSFTIVSLPSLGAWIETDVINDLMGTTSVAPFIGSVD